MSRRVLNNRLLCGKGPCDMDETWQSDRARGPAGLAVLSPNEMGQYDFSNKATCSDRESSSRKDQRQRTSKQLANSF